MSQNHDQGSFLTGFTVGLFAGAAGYFMFGTNKGKKLREQLSREWEHARIEVGEQGLPNQSFREMIKSLVKTFQEATKVESPVSEKHSTHKKPTKPPTKDSKPKFKGT